MVTRYYMRCYVVRIFTLIIPNSRDYILSPLSDEIRRVYNESHGPMFKNVIPPDEFDYICTEMKSGEELHYTLILANIHKKGLQKLEFSVKKKINRIYYCFVNSHDF